jgi:hypothetical protein
MPSCHVPKEETWCLICKHSSPYKAQKSEQAQDKQLRRLIRPQEVIKIELVGNPGYRRLIPEQKATFRELGYPSNSGAAKIEVGLSIMRGVWRQEKARERRSKSYTGRPNETYFVNMSVC